MKLTMVFRGTLEIGLMTVASIIGSYVYLVVDRKGGFVFSEFEEFLRACGWIYALGSLVMHVANLFATRTQYPIRLLLFLVFGLTISYLCHVLLSVISWYWSIRLVLLVAAILMSCSLVANVFQQKRAQVNSIGNR